MTEGDSGLLFATAGRIARQEHEVHHTVMTQMRLSHLSYVIVKSSRWKSDAYYIL